MHHLIKLFANVNHWSFLRKGEEPWAILYFGFLEFVRLFDIDLKYQSVSHILCDLFLEMLIEIDQIESPPSSLSQTLLGLNHVLCFILSNNKLIKSSDYSFHIDMEQLYKVILYNFA
jgi:hypothetical protein